MPIGYIHMPAKITDSLSFRSASSASSFRAGTSCPSRRSVRPRCQAAIPSPETMVMTSIWGRSFWAATVARLEEDTPAITLTLIPVAFSKGSNMLCWNALPQTPPQVAMTTSCATAGATGRPPITATSVRHESASFIMDSLRVVGQFGLGTGSSCEPDEARGSQLCPAYSLYVERRWRPSNVAVAYRSRESEASGEMARKTWRSKLAQYQRSGLLDSGIILAEPGQARAGRSSIPASEGRPDMAAEGSQQAGSIATMRQDPAAAQVPADVAALVA